MSAIALIAALVAGKIAFASLTVADYAALASAGFTVARLAIVLDQRIVQRPPYKRRQMAQRYSEPQYTEILIPRLWIIPGVR